MVLYIGISVIMYVNTETDLAFPASQDMLLLYEIFRILQFFIIKQKNDVNVISYVEWQHLTTFVKSDIDSL